jgi:Mn-dependent DtxR family transcriptional regulator
MTKDEKYLIKLYEEAKKSGNPTNHKDRYKIGEMLGLSDKVVNGMMNGFVQANFVKKIEERGVQLTPHGVKLVLALLDE